MRSEVHLDDLFRENNLNHHIRTQRPTTTQNYAPPRTDTPRQAKSQPDTIAKSQLIISYLAGREPGGWIDVSLLCGCLKGWLNGPRRELGHKADSHSKELSINESNRHWPCFTEMESALLLPVLGEFSNLATLVYRPAHILSHNTSGPKPPHNHPPAPYLPALRVNEAKHIF
jgi:hypothetical protein